MSLIDALIPKDAIARAQQALQAAEARRAAAIQALLPHVDPQIVRRVIALSSASSLRVAAVSAKGSLGEVLNKVAAELEKSQQP